MLTEKYNPLWIQFWRSYPKSTVYMYLQLLFLLSNAKDSAEEERKEVLPKSQLSYSKNSEEIEPKFGTTVQNWAELELSNPAKTQFQQTNKHKFKICFEREKIKHFKKSFQ